MPSVMRAELGRRTNGPFRRFENERSHCTTSLSQKKGRTTFAADLRSNPDNLSMGPMARAGRDLAQHM